MMRVRIDGGQLTSDAAAGHRRHQHRVRPRRRRRHRPAERPAALDPHRGRARRSGSGSRRSGCRPPRPAATPRAVMLGCPLAGVLEDEVLDASDVLAETVAKYVGHPEFSNLPRKWKTSMSGCVDHCTEPRDQRRLLRRRARTTTARPASTCGSAAGCRPTRCSPSGSASSSAPTQVTDVWAACTSIFRDYGYRRSAQPRPDEVPHGRLGPGEVPPGAAGRVPARGAARRPGRRRPPKHDQRDHVGVSKQKDGANARRLRAAHRPDQRHRC